MQKISQRTLGLVRDAMEALQPEEVFSFTEWQQFWKKILFDAGLPPAFIDIAATYNFNWVDVVPHLYTGKFGDQNQHFRASVPPALQDEYLKRLVKFALAQSENTLLGQRLLESLRPDLQPTTGGPDKNIPSELARVPTKETLFTDLPSALQGESPLALLFIDLDNFKQVNDQFGHTAGDKCLVDSVSKIVSVIQGKGKLYRCGGDEFAVLLPNFSASEAHASAERIRAAIQGMSPVGGRIAVTASIGVASADTSDRLEAEALYERADEAMYVAKFTTRNRVSVWPPSREDKELVERNRNQTTAVSIR